jgi:hypothetical protein
MNHWGEDFTAGDGAGGFNLTIEEVKILVKYRRLSRHQQKGIMQAIELIRPAALDRKVNRNRGALPTHR